MRKLKKAQVSNLTCLWHQYKSLKCFVVELLYLSSTGPVCWFTDLLQALCLGTGGDAEVWYAFLFSLMKLYANPKSAVFIPKSVYASSRSNHNYIVSLNVT